MEGEPGVLEQRVEAAALERRRIEPEERVGGEARRRDAVDEQQNGGDGDGFAKTCGCGIWFGA